MNIKQWFRKRGNLVIGTEGRGSAYVEPIGDNKFGIGLTDAQLNESTQESPVLNGRDNVNCVAVWFAKQVSYSPEDEKKILSDWKLTYFPT